MSQNRCPSSACPRTAVPVPHVPEPLSQFRMCQDPVSQFQQFAYYSYLFQESLGKRIPPKNDRRCLQRSSLYSANILEILKSKMSIENSLLKLHTPLFVNPFPSLTSDVHRNNFKNSRPFSHFLCGIYRHNYVVIYQNDLVYRYAVIV